MSTEQNKALVRRFYEEVWNKGNFSLADELVDDDGSRYDHETIGPNSAEIQKQAAAGITDYTGQNMWRVRNGKLVEVRNNRDDLLVFYQLGLIPSRAELWKQAGVFSSPYIGGATDQAQAEPAEAEQT